MLNAKEKALKELDKRIENLQKEILLLKEERQYMSGRATGKTTRVLLKAILALSEGCNVVVLSDHPTHYLNNVLVPRVWNILRILELDYKSAGYVTVLSAANKNTPPRLYFKHISDDPNSLRGFSGPWVLIEDIDKNKTEYVCSLIEHFHQIIRPSNFSASAVNKQND